ncbi:hypothetical protein [Paenibacillus motobuensis]|jgi:hypothetical protein|uniref:hypothetical protein n=1 Tax=Paenibacillus motobuensis TaxID=295324 RepID=UPI0031D8289D
MDSFLLVMGTAILRDDRYGYGAAKAATIQLHVICLPPPAIFHGHHLLKVRVEQSS